MHESIVFCSTCTTSSYRKFTFAISSADEFLVLFVVFLLVPVLFACATIITSFTVFYCTSCIAFLFLLLILSICLSVSCSCLWAMLPDLNKMMTIIIMW